MSTLLLRCVGPMQSWGTRSRFGERDTEREPSKSGIVGLLAAALGRDRHEEMEDLNVLRMGVRVDREGRVLRDFHTAQDVCRAGGGQAPTVISNRYYLMDAAFLVGLEGDYELLKKLYAALKAPKWPLFLGRKSCPPALPIWLPDGVLKNGKLEETLRTYPSILPQVPCTPPERLRLVIECRPGEEGHDRQDVPLSFDPLRRRYGIRKVRLDHCASPQENDEKEAKCTSAD